MSSPANIADPGSGLRRLTATRYVTALREGGSVPAVVEADDGALYVVKFRAAAQGGRVLAAEVIVGELARAARPARAGAGAHRRRRGAGRSEPHQEIQELLIASAGLNLAMAYLSRRDRLRRGGAPAGRRRAGVGDRGAGRVRRQRRSHGAQPEPALARRRAVAHRSRRLALLAPRLGRQPDGGRAGGVGGAPVRARRAITCSWRRPIGCPPRGGAGGGLGRRGDRAGGGGRPRRVAGRAGGDRLRAAYLAWLRARRAALPAIIDEANRVRASARLIT